MVPPSGRGRPRSVDSAERILDAAATLLDEVGLARMTMVGVADRAGVSTATLYRWWPSKGAVALDAFLHRIEPAIAFPDSGDLAADLAAQVSAVIRLFRDTRDGRTIASLVAELQHDEELGHQFRERFTAARRATARARLTSAQLQGDLAPGVDLETMIDILYGPVYYRLLVGHQPLTDALAGDLTAAALAWAGTAVTSRR